MSEVKLSREMESGTCFQCSKLEFGGYHCICKENRYTFTMIEKPMVGCHYNNLERKNLTGQSENLLRLLGLTQSVLMRSIPKNMIGAIGVLKKYDLITVKEGTIHKAVKGNINSSKLITEKFLYLKGIE